VKRKNINFPTDALRQSSDPLAPGGITRAATAANEVE
jgi:hypothetical protein